MRAWSPAAMALAFCGLACDRAPAQVEVLRASDAEAPATAQDAPCVPAIAEKIGVPFIRVCAPRAGAPAGSF